MELHRKPVDYEKNEQYIELDPKSALLDKRDGIDGWSERREDITSMDPSPARNAGRTGATSHSGAGQ